MSPVDDSNVGLAFGLVAGAGAATGLGAAVVFFPSLVKLASRRVLASALGISAGVMTYVSFVEIFQKSNSSFVEAGHTEEEAYLYATLCFFGGVVFMLLVDFAVKFISKDHHHDHHGHTHEGELGASCEKENGEASEEENDEREVVSPHCPCCSDDPVHDLEQMQEMAKDVTMQQQQQHQHHQNQGSSNKDDSFVDNPADMENNSNSEDDQKNEGTTKSATTKLTKQEIDARKENRKLVKMGINTAIAIGLHNFPEGLATFVATLDDPRVGTVLAVAIGIHNIPEGLCVALPIYYATGNRWKAFGWALVSGASEPIAALLGWAILANSFSDDLYAVLFGFVAGMMIIISARELLPTAHRYDPEDTVVTYSFIAGMVVMALSLVLFVF